MAPIVIGAFCPRSTLVALEIEAEGLDVGMYFS